MTVMIGEMNWCDYHQRIKDGTPPVFIPLGALEQHGPHMSMNVDVLLPTAMAQAVATETKGMVAPAFVYGCKSQVRSGGGNHLPGTTSLDGEVFSHTLRDVLCEFARHGARRFVLINGHFENSQFITEGIDLALRRLQSFGIKGVRVMVLSYWDFIGEQEITKLYPNNSFPGWSVEHGGVLETSMMLYLHPELVNMNAAVDIAPAQFPPYDVFPPDPTWTPAPGTLSSPKNASREKGELIVSVCRDKIIDGVHDVFGK